MNRRHKLLLCSVFSTAIFLFFIILALFITNLWMKTLLAFVFASGIAIPITGSIDSSTQRKLKSN